MVKVAIRAVIAPSTADLRFIDISDAAARRLSRWLGMITTVLIYLLALFLIVAAGLMA